MNRTIVTVIVVVGLSIAALTAFRPALGAERWEDADLGPVTAVKIEGGAGDVKINREGESGKIRYAIERGWPAGVLGINNNAEQPYRIDGNELILVSACGWNCAVDYEVSLPSQVPVSGNIGSGDMRIAEMTSVDVLNGSGRVEITDVSGTVRTQAGSGAVQVARIGGPMDLRVASGKIRGEELQSPIVNVEAGSGSIDLQFDEAEQVSAQTASGNLDLVVPATSYRLATQAGSGRQNINVPNDPASPRSLTVSTGSGNLTVEAHTE